MKNIQEMSKTAVEVLTVLEYVDYELREEIPISIYNYLKELAYKSNYNFEFDENKSLREQNISEQSKDFLSLIYYSYIAENSEKQQLEDIWKENEDIYRNTIDKNLNFKNINTPEIVIEDSVKQEVEMMLYKESFFSKIISKLKSIIKK